MENKSLEQIIESRLEKLKKIRDLGINPYPYEFKCSHTTSEVTEDIVDKKVSVAGRVMSLRNMEILRHFFKKAVPDPGSAKRWSL